MAKSPEAPDAPEARSQVVPASHASGVATPARGTVGLPGEIDVGQRLRQLRIEAGLSQRALARKAGVSNATISMVESNQVSPSISALRQILAGFPLGIAEFFSAPEPDVEQVVFRASEFTEIAGGAVSYR